MQAVILAAGRSSRLYPFATEVHKSMIPLLGKPILAYTIEGLNQAGIKDIVVIVRNDGIVEKYFGDGRGFGMNITYVVQKEPLGMGDALLSAKKHLKDRFILLGAHHVNCKNFIKDILAKYTTEVDGVLLAKQRTDTWNFGVAVLKKDRVLGIVEKPKRGKEPSSHTLVSIYALPLYFISFLEKIKKHNYSFEEALDLFVKEKKVVGLITKEEITTLKYPWDLLNVKNYLLKTMKTSISKKTTLAKSAEILGNVVIEDGVRIMEGVRIKGPCFIGKGVTIGNNVLLRNGVDIEEGAIIGGFTEIKNSLVMKGATTHSGFIGDSVVGEYCKIAAQFCTANVRLDRDTVKVWIKDKKVDTGLKYLGVMMSDKARMGIKVSTMPGIFIGKNAIIGPSTTVLRNVGENVRYYTKFQEIVEEK